MCSPSGWHWLTFIALISAVGLSDETWQGNRLPFPPFRDPRPLAGKDLQACQQALLDLDADSYDRREAAQEKLLRFGLRAQALVQRAVIEAEASDRASLEVIHRLITIDRELPDADRKNIGDYLNDQSKHAPLKYEPPAADIVQRMERRISFNFVDLPLSEALARLERHTGVPIAVDPEAEDPGFPRLTLVVADLASDVALGWVCRLADLSWAYHSNGVLVGAERVRTIGTMEETVTLDAQDGGPWTTHETRQWCNLLSTPQGGPIPWARNTYTPDVEILVAGPGSLKVRGLNAQLAKFDGWLSKTQQGWESVEDRFPGLKVWADARRHAMGRVFVNEPLTVSLKTTWEGLGARWSVHPDLVQNSTSVMCLEANVAMGCWLQNTCALRKWALVPDETTEGWTMCVMPWSSRNFNVSAVIPFAFNMPRLHLEETEKQLQSVLLSSPLPCSGARLRNLYLGYADAWTVMRMEDCVRPPATETAGP